MHFIFYFFKGTNSFVDIINASNYSVCLMAIRKMNTVKQEITVISIFIKQEEIENDYT